MEENTTTPAAEAPKSKTGIITGVIVLVVIAAGAYFIFGNKNQAVPIASENPAIASNSNLETFTIEGSSFAFNPAAITVKTGDSVKITFKDSDGRHNLVIDGYDLSTKIIGPGATDTIEFTADKTGTFEYYCSLPGHKDQGMMGKLVVI